MRSDIVLEVLLITGQMPISLLLEKGQTQNTKVVKGDIL